MDIQQLTQAHDQHAAELRLAKTNADIYRKAAAAAKMAVEQIDEATFYINEAAKLTQDQIKDQVESLVTAAMDMVFDQHYDFRLQFNRTGNRLDCRAVLMDGERGMDDPEFDVGGSRVGTVSIALRVVIWSLEEDQPRGVFILDEPFTDLGSSHLLDRTLEMVQRLSKELGIQMLIITHIERAQAIADRAWHVANINGRASVECTVGMPAEERIKA